MSLQPLLDASPAIQIHAFAAIVAFLLGAAVLFRRKGDRLHRIGGRIWVALMLVVALSSFFIHTIHMWGLWSPIHLLSIATLLSLAYAIQRIRSRDVIAHAATMKTTYAGALVVAGVFTLAPGRIMNSVMFGSAGATHAAPPAAITSDQGPTVLSVVTDTPLWVWPLLLYVLYVGWNGTKDRIVAPWRLLVMPAIIAGLALYNLLWLSRSAVGFIGFAGGAVAGTLAGLALARRRPAERRGDGMLALKGDRVPFMLMTGIFAVRYATGVALGIEPSLASDAAFQIVNLWLSGLFTAMMIALTAGMLPRATVRSASLAPKPAGQLAQQSTGK